MHKSTITSGQTQTHLFHADRPMDLKPRIKQEIYLEGVKYYLGENDKMYEAAQFDKYFNGVKMTLKSNKIYKERNVRIDNVFEY